MSKKPSQLPPYRSSIAGTLLAAREAVMAPIRPELRAANVTEQQWRVLRVLAEESTMDAASIASAAMLHAPSVTRILKEFLDRGLIERSVDERDGRRSVVAISAAGREVLTTTARSTFRLLTAYRNAFGAERLADLQRELAAFAASIAGLSPED